MDSDECPGCNCSEGPYCNTFLIYRKNRNDHWFTYQGKIKGTVHCEFCDLVIEGEVEL